MLAQDWDRTLGIIASLNATPRTRPGRVCSLEVPRRGEHVVEETWPRQSGLPGDETGAYLLDEGTLVRCRLEADGDEMRVRQICQCTDMGGARQDYGWLSAA